MISFDVYNVFYHVCKFKSITKAANYLHVSQPAITRHIKNLEMHLDVTLFHRTKKGLTLTNEGEELFKDVEKGIDIFNNIEVKYNSKKDVDSGTIHILAGYGTTKLILFPAIIEFNKMYPKVNFQIDHYPTKDGLEKLRNGIADILLLNPKANDYYNDLLYVPFYSIHNTFVVSTTIDKDIPDKINLKDLNNYPVIAKKSPHTINKFINEELNKLDMEFKPKWELNDYWLVKEYIKMNMGIGIIAREIMQEYIDKGEYREIKTDIEIPEIRINYAIRKNSILSPILIKFIKFLKEREIKQKDL